MEEDRKPQPLQGPWRRGPLFRPHLADHRFTMQAGNRSVVLRLVAALPRGHFVDDETMELTLRRIISCLNFCADIPDEVLTREARSDEDILAMCVLQRKEAASQALVDCILGKGRAHEPIRYVYECLNHVRGQGYVVYSTTVDMELALKTASDNAADADSDNYHEVLRFDIITGKTDSVETFYPTGYGYTNPYTGQQG